MSKETFDKLYQALDRLQEVLNRPVNPRQGSQVPSIVKEAVKEATYLHNQIIKEIDAMIVKHKKDLQDAISPFMKNRINQTKNKNITNDIITNKIKKQDNIIIAKLNEYDKKINEMLKISFDITANNLEDAKTYEQDPIKIQILTSAINSKKSIEKTRKELETYSKEEIKNGLTKEFKNKKTSEETDTSHSLIKNAKQDEVWNYECIYASGSKKITIKKIYVVAINKSNLLYIDAAEKWQPNVKNLKNKVELPIITAMPESIGLYNKELIRVKTFAVVGTTDETPILIPDIHSYKWIGPEKPSIAPSQ